MAMEHSPDPEMPVSAPHAGMAEQDPGMWWGNTGLAIKNALSGAI